MTRELPLKSVSVATNAVGLQTAFAVLVGLNSSAHVARRSGLQTKDFVVTETGFKILHFKD